MEMVASEAEMDLLLKEQANQSYLVWTATVHNTTSQTLRMHDRLPRELATSSPNATARVTLDGRFVQVVQVTVYALHDIDGIDVTFEGDGVSCLQTSGVDYMGREFVPRKVSIPKGKVGQLFFLIDKNATSGQKVVTLAPKNGLDKKVIVIDVVHDGHLRRHRNEASADSPDTTDLWQLSRLAWLNSKTGIDDSITRPYSPIEASESGKDGSLTLLCRGRSITISAQTGLPREISSNGRAVLVGEGISFDVEGAASLRPARKLELSMGPGNATVSWLLSLESTDGTMTMTVEGEMAYDGHLEFAVTVDTKVRTTLPDAALNISVSGEIARFANGGGYSDNGGYFPAPGNESSLDWSWKDFNSKTPDPHAPAGDPVSPAGWRLWLGDVDAGLFLKLKGSELAWNSASPNPASVPDPPRSWSGASGKSGTIKVRKDEPSNIVSVAANTGPTAATPLVFNFSILATPVKGDYTHTAAGRREHYEKTRRL